MASDYELQRQQRIASNRRKLEELGLVAASRRSARTNELPLAAPEAVCQQQPRTHKRRVEQQAAPCASLEPPRLSRRLRGEPALGQAAAAAQARAEVKAEGPARARRGATHKKLVLEEGVQLAAPFSLWSIGVTVWDLGCIHRGAWAQRYWSSPGCLYHHAYPVGYRATKVQFGHTFEMRIEEGLDGPLFKVIDQETGATFSGSSPTKPWTDVCLAHRTGQRISGPLFFGFSDPVTQQAIARNLYTHAELKAALLGEKVEPSPAGSPEERAAREFATVEGVGEATAILLATTKALGGRQHGGLASLQCWAGATDRNAQGLWDFLTSSSEVPESTRRWPAWRQHVVPKIVRALSGRRLGGRPPRTAATAAVLPAELRPGMAAPECAHACSISSAGGSSIESDQLPPAAAVVQQRLAQHGSIGQGQGSCQYQLHRGLGAPVPKAQLAGIVLEAEVPAKENCRPLQEAPEDGLVKA